MNSDFQRIINFVQQDFFRIAKKIESQSVERDNALSQQISSVLQHQSLHGQISILQQQKEILSHLYDKASAYTNLIILAGYAGIFGIWQMTWNSLSADANILVASLIATSIMLFAAFEVSKMILQALFLRKLDKIIMKDFLAAERIEAWTIGLNEFSAQQTRIWMWFLVPTVLTGFGGGFILLWLFVRNLSAFNS